MPCATRRFASTLRALRSPTLMSRSVSEQWTRWRTAIRGVNSSTPEVLAPDWVLLSQPIFAYSTSSVPLAGTSRFRRMAVYTECLRCAGAPRRPASGSVLSLYVPSRHAVLYGHGESIGCSCSVLHRWHGPSPRAYGSALPRLPIIRFRRAEGFRGFTGSLSLQPVELLVSLADLTGVSPSQRRLLPPSFPTGRSPFPRSDITTVVTERAPPMGLSPIGTSASIAAQAPSLRRSYPASPVLRASPPSQSARPVSHELPVDPYRDHRWDFPCCAWSPLPACRRQYPGRSDGICSLVRFH